MIKGSFVEKLPIYEVLKTGRVQSSHSSVKLQFNSSQVLVQASNSSEGRVQLFKLILGKKGLEHVS